MKHLRNDALGDHDVRFCSRPDSEQVLVLQLRSDAEMGIPRCCHGEAWYQISVERPLSAAVSRRRGSQILTENRTEETLTTDSHLCSSIFV